MEINEIKKILLELQFNVNSKGFEYWLHAIHLYTTFNEKITMTEMYNELAFEFTTTSSVIERNMRTASNSAIPNIRKYFNYNTKISNKTILNLFRKNMEE